MVLDVKFPVNLEKKAQNLCRMSYFSFQKECPPGPSKFPIVQWSPASPDADWDTNTATPPAAESRHNMTQSCNKFVFIDSYLGIIVSCGITTT